MRNTTLGRTGIEVSPIAFGTWQLGGDWGNFDQSEAIDAIRAADLELDASDLERIDEIMSGAVAVAGPTPETT